jgi:hypothetical protein
MRSLPAILAAAAAVLTVKAGPFAPPQPVADVALPAGLAGTSVVSGIAGIELDGVDGVLSLSSQLDRLVFHPPSPGAARVIDADLRGGSALGVIDADGDGDQDIVTASRWRREIYLHRNEGGGNFAARETLATGIDSAIVLLAARIDGDTRDDLLGITDHDRRIFWLRGSAAGLEPVQTLFHGSAPLRALAAADMNGDGFHDLVVAHGRQSLTLLNQAGGGFQVGQTLDFNAVQFLFADLDGDGRPDLLARHADSGGVVIFPGQTGGTLGAAILLPVRARDMAALDLDGDADADLVIAPADGGSLLWLENTGAFGFSAARPAGAARASMMVAEDSDGDGHADLHIGDARDTGLSLLASFAGRPYERWADDFDLGDAAGPEDDANGDGRPNVFDYALGLDPGEPAGVDLLETGVDGIHFAFARRDSSPPTGLTYLVETSANLAGWDEVAEESLVVSPLSPGWQRVRLKLDPHPGGRRFARLRVTYQNP